MFGLQQSNTMDQKIFEAVQQDLRSRIDAYNAITEMEVEYPDHCEEVMEVEYPDMEKQMDELCLQFEKLRI